MLGGGNEVTVSLDIPELPENFIAAAYLLDSENNYPLCDAFTTELYTREMKALRESTTADYAEELVLNLDEDTSTNFAVYNETTVLVEESASENQLTDNGDGSYTVTNAGAEFTGLAAGDTFSYTYEDGMLLLVKVGTVTVEGSTVTITEDSDTELSDYFDYLKIEEDSNGCEMHVDNSGLEEGVTYLGTGAAARRAARDIDEDAQYSHGMSYGVSLAGLSAEASLNVTLSLTLYDTPERSYFSQKLDYSSRISVKGKAELFQKDIKLGNVDFPLLGGLIRAGFQPVIRIEASAVMEAGVQIAGAAGFSYDSLEGRKNLSSPPRISVDAAFGGTVYIGLAIVPNVKFISEKLFKAELDISVGVEANSKVSVSTEGSGVLHECNQCFDGELSAKFGVEAGIKQLFMKWTIYEWTKKLGDFYWCVDHVKVGMGECPRKRYPVEVSVTDALGHPVTGAKLTAASPTGQAVELMTADGAEAVTDQTGKRLVYLPKGAYQLCAQSGEVTGQQPVSVREEKQTVSIELEAVQYEVRLLALDESGSPVEGAVVYGESVKGACMTGTDGRVSLKLPAGTHELRLETDTLKGTAEITVESADVETTVVLRAELCYDVRLTAVDRDGSPVEGAVLSGDGVEEACRTDADGTVTLKLPKGRYSLKLWTETSEGTADVTVEDAAVEMTVTMEATAQYQVRLAAMDAAGAPVAGAAVSGTGVPEGTETDAEGRATLSLPLGTHGLSLRKDLLRGETVVTIEDADVEATVTMAEAEKEDETETETEEGGGENPDEGEEREPGEIYWTLKDGVLRIYGHGDMPDYDYIWPGELDTGDGKRMPWWNKREEIHTVIIEERISYIGAYALSGCMNLSKAVIGNGVTEIGEGAFDSSFYSTSEVVLPDSVKKIDRRAFCNAPGLINIKLPSNLEVIGEDAFDCSGLRKVRIPGSVKTIGQAAFSTCLNLVSVVLEEGVTATDALTFEGCRNLSYVRLPESLLELGYRDFMNCVSLKNIVLPGKITAIRDRTFSGCSSLESIRIPNNVTDIDLLAFEDCVNLTNVTFPNELKTIWEGAFRGCKKLTNVKLPDQLLRIDSDAFANCSALTSITIPESVSSLWPTFSSCDNLKKIYFRDYVWLESSGTDYDNGLEAFCGQFDTTVKVYYPYRCKRNSTGDSGVNPWEQDFEIYKVKSKYRNVSWIRYVPSSSGQGSGSLPGDSEPKPLYRVQIKVTDNYGAPVQGARIRATDIGTGSEIAVLTQGEEQSPVTGEDGMLTAYLPEGSCMLEAEDGDVGGIRNVTVNGDDTVVELTIEYPLYSVVLHALDESGYPVAGAVVSGTGMAEDPVTDDTGTVKLSLKNGVHDLELRTESLEANARITVQDADVDLDVTMTEHRYKVSLYVYQRTEEGWGVAVEGAEVSGDGVTGVSVSDAEGTVVLELRPGVHKLTVRKGTLEGEIELTVENSETYYTVYLEPMKHDVLLYAQDESGNPVAGATVTGDALEESIVTDSEGKVSLRLPDGEYSLSLAWERLRGTAQINVQGSDTEQTVTMTRQTVSVDGIEWILEDGVLNIFGTSEMVDYYSGSAPWYASGNEIQRVIIHDGVTRVGAGAFGYMSNLTAVSLPDSITEIGNGAFSGCSSLTDISIPDSVTVIGPNAFSSCRSLTGIVIPDGVTVISEHTFSNCPKLSSVAIPNSVTTIDKYAFYSSGLKELTLPEGIKLINNEAFAYCSHFAELVLPASLEKIEYGAFSHCSGLTEIVFPAVPIEMGEGVFAVCDNLTVLRFTGNAPANLECLNGLSLTVYYPAGNTTWDSYVGAGTEEFAGITWTAYDPAEVETEASPLEEPGETSADGGLELDLFAEEPGEHGDDTAAEAEMRETSAADLPESADTEWMEEIFPEQESVSEDGNFYEEGSFSVEEIQPVPGDASGEMGTPDAGMPDGEGSDVILVEEAFAEVYASTPGTSGTFAAAFSGLIPGEPYVFALVKNADYAFSSSNLLYIAQQNADVDGSVTFRYVPREETGGMISQIYGRTLPDLKDAEVIVPAMTDNGSVQTVAVEVYYDGKLLQQDVDYTLSGDTSVSEAGAYTVTVTGIHTYTGSVSVSFTVAAAHTHSFGEPVFKWDGTGSCQAVFTCKDVACKEPQTAVCSITAVPLSSACLGTKYTANVIFGGITYQDEKTAGAGHTAGTWTVTKAATCTEAGEQVQKCTVCGEIINRGPLEAKGHTAGAWTVTRNATCTEAGEQVQNCTVCGAAVNTQALELAAHSWGAWETASEATVFQPAVSKRTCGICGTAEIRDSGEKLAATITVTATSVPLKVKQSTTKLKVSGLAAGDSVASWKSSNRKIVKVNSKGKLTAGKKTGKATVTVTLASGLQKKITVKVQKRKVTTTKITGVRKKLTLKKGQKLTLKPQLKPITSQEKLTYKSSNPRAASVSSKGVIRAKKKGTATITVRSGKKKAVCKVKVE